MNWEATGAIAEGLGALAVIGSLLFVGNQLRQNQMIARGNAQRELLVGANEWMISTREDPELFATVSRLLHGYEGASADDRHQFSTWAYDCLFLCERAFYMHRDGYMNEGSWQGFRGMCLSLLLSPGGAQWWAAEARHVWGADAVEHFDAAIAQSDDATPRMQQLRPEFGAKFAELAAAEA